MASDSRGLSGDFWIGVGIFLILRIVSVLIAWVPGMILSRLAGANLLRALITLTYFALMIWLIIWARQKKRLAIIKGYFVALLITIVFKTAYSAYMGWGLR